MRRLALFAASAAFVAAAMSPLLAFEQKDMEKLFETRTCPGCDLIGAYLIGAYLSSANLSGANLSGADLSGATLQEATLRNANLTNADLSRANLTDADLRSADLTGADLLPIFSLDGVVWGNTTCPDGSNSDTFDFDEFNCDFNLL